MHVSACVYVYVSMSVSTCARLSLCTAVFASMCISVCLCLCLSPCVYVYVPMSVCPSLCDHSRKTQRYARICKQPIKLLSW